MLTSNEIENEQSIPARRDDVVLEELDGEALVYDPVCGAVHRFTHVVLFVWSGCDGTHTMSDIIDEMTKRYGIDADQAARQGKKMIADLQRLGLLHDDAIQCSEDEEPPISGSKATQTHQAVARWLSRRQWIGGGVGMLVFAPPVISTFFATGSHAAASNPINPGFSPVCGAGEINPGYSCTTNQDCCDIGGPSSTTCEPERGVCCVKNNSGPCYRDEDCCSGATCDAGICKN